MGRKNDVGFASHIDRELAFQQDHLLYFLFENDCPKFEDGTTRCNGYGGHCSANRRARCEYYKDYKSRKAVENSQGGTNKQQTQSNKKPKSKRLKNQSNDNLICVFEFTLSNEELKLILKYLADGKKVSFTSNFMINKNFDHVLPKEVRILLKNGTTKYWCRYIKDKSIINAHKRSFDFDLTITRMIADSGQPLAKYSEHIAKGKRNKIHNGKVIFYWD